MPSIDLCPSSSLRISNWIPRIIRIHVDCSSEDGFPDSASFTWKDPLCLLFRVLETWYYILNSFSIVKCWHSSAIISPSFICWHVILRDTSTSQSFSYPVGLFVFWRLPLDSGLHLLSCKIYDLLASYRGGQLEFQRTLLWTSLLQLLPLLMLFANFRRYTFF